MTTLNNPNLYPFFCAHCGSRMGWYDSSLVDEPRGVFHDTCAKETPNPTWLADAVESIMEEYKGEMKWTIEDLYDRVLLHLYTGDHTAYPFSISQEMGVTFNFLWNSIPEDEQKHVEEILNAIDNEVM